MSRASSGWRILMKYIGLLLWCASIQLSSHLLCQASQTWRSKHDNPWMFVKCTKRTAFFDPPICMQASASYGLHSAFESGRHSGDAWGVWSARNIEWNTQENSRAWPFLFAKQLTIWCAWFKYTFGKPSNVVNFQSCTYWKSTKH
jgi:hypothetical protein